LLLAYKKGSSPVNPGGTQRGLFPKGLESPKEALTPPKSLPLRGTPGYPSKGLNSFQSSPPVRNPKRG